MKRLSLNIILLLILGILLSGCFVFMPAGSSQSTEQSSSQSQTISQLLTRRWNILQVYFTANSQMYNNHGASGWIQFYSNGTCSQQGLFSTNQTLRWTVKGQKLIIKGYNIVYSDGNLTSSEITYNIVKISGSELHLSRWDGKKSNGADIYRHIRFN